MAFNPRDPSFHKSNYSHKVDLFRIRRNKRKEKSRSQAFEDSFIEWTSFYRANPHRFVEDYFNIKLKPFQCILLWAMMNNYFFMFIGSRGIGKSFLTAIYVCVRCVLYPETKIIITSGVKSQGISVIRKIKDEILSKSPLFQREVRDLNTGNQDPRIDFYNGSWIRVVAPKDSARGARANLLLVDEFILVEKDIIDTVFKKMLTSPRHPKFLNKPEYANREDLRERNMQMYLSSAGMKTHWGYETMKSYTKQMLNGANYFVCHLPYYLGIQEKIYDHEAMKEEAQESGFSEMKWAIEMEAVWWGETESAFFKFNDIDINRQISTAYYPRDREIITMQNPPEIPKKLPKEKRILSVDVAAMAGNSNDASVFTLLCIIPKGKRYERQVRYMEDMVGTDFQTQALRVRQLFKDFDCDYIVLDSKNVGMGIYDNLIIPLHDPKRGEEYEPLNCMNREDLQDRCKDPLAPKVIYAIAATNELNMEIANRMANSLKMGLLRLLVPETVGREGMIQDKKIKFEELPENVQAKLRYPYMQTEYFILEVMNLETKLSDNNTFKLVTSGTARKDRYSSLSYGNYFASELERDLIKPEGKFDPKAFGSFRKPKSII